MIQEQDFCPKCEAYRPTRVVERQERYTVRDRSIQVAVKTPICDVCGGSLGSDEADQAVLDAVYAEYRRQNNLLTPSQIEALRRRYRLSQKSFAALLGMSEATINRYEQGALQDPSHDTVMRACENPQIVRDLLARRGHLLSDWQRRRVEATLAGQEKTPDPWFDLVTGGGSVQAANEISDRTGYRRFDFGRYAAAVIWFCDRLNSVSKTVINKLVFYADFLNYRTSTVSLTGTAYRRAPYGPVPADYGMLLDWMEAQGLIQCREVEYPNGQTGFFYSPGTLAQSISVTFSPHERKVLEHVADQVGRLSAKDISRRSHQEAAWRETEDGKLISYQFARQLSLSLPD